MEINSYKENTIWLEDLVIGYRSGHEKNTKVFGPVTTGIRESEMVGIIGRNGIGKSTLLRTIAALQPSLSGSILLKGEHAGSINRSDLAKIIAFVSTESIHSFEIKVKELIAMGRYPYTGWLGKLSENDHQSIEVAINQIGIAHLRNKSLHELSDGERQKVMIARALAQDTPIIILDEPTAFLDLPARYDIMRILSNLSLKSRKTILFSTHDLAIALDVADKLWLLADNQIFEGAPEDLLIRKVFRKLFLNSPAEFDLKTSTFKFKRNLTGKVEIKGLKKYRPLTKKALERIGIQEVEEETGCIIELEETEEKPLWKVTINGNEHSFFTIYALIAYLKTEFNNS